MFRGANWAGMGALAAKASLSFVPKPEAWSLRPPS